MELSNTEAVGSSDTPQCPASAEAHLRSTTPEITVESERDCVGGPSDPIAFDLLKLYDEATPAGLMGYKGVSRPSRPTSSDSHYHSGGGGGALRSSRRRTTIEEPYVFSVSQLTLGVSRAAALDFRRLSDPGAGGLLRRRSTDPLSPPSTKQSCFVVGGGGGAQAVTAEPFDPVKAETTPPGQQTPCGAAGDARRGVASSSLLSSVSRAVCGPFLCLPESSMRPRSQSLGCTLLEAIAEESSVAVPKTNRRYSSPAAAESRI